MIDHKYKFIFVHILKTAGTSIEQLFSNFPTDKKDVEFKHNDIFFYYKKFPEKTAEYFKFTFVRNPWDRLVSQYQWRLFKGYQNPNQPFAEWLRDSYDQWRNSQLRVISINNEIKMDFIGRFENLQEDWEKICDILGIHQKVLPHLNNLSHRPHYSEFYDDQTRDLVASGCKEEIEFFNYTFTGKDRTMVSPKKQKEEPWRKYLAKATGVVSPDVSRKGENGGPWTWFTHLAEYGPNFDRGLANFLSGILRPRSALEFGCGIGLYINYMEKFSTATDKDSTRFIGIEPESMIDAGIFDSDGFKAKQLVMSIFEVEPDVLESLAQFEVVLSSEVAEHIPLKLHKKMTDFLVSKTEKFLVFGAARKDQGGIGHLRESMHDMPYWINKFEEKGMIHLEKLSERLRDSCFNRWDKGRNTFIMVNPQFHDESMDERLSGLDDVSDIFPGLVQP